MHHLTLKNFLRVSLLVSFVLGLCFCGVYCYSMAKIEYSDRLQNLTNSKQAEIIDLESQVQKLFADLLDKLIEVHTLDDQGVNEFELRKNIDSVKAQLSLSEIHHELILLNTYTKRNLFRAFRRYLAGKNFIPSIRGRPRRCQRDDEINTKLDQLSIQLGVDRDLQKIWINKQDWIALDGLDSKYDQVLNHNDYTDCLKKTVMKFHYDSYLHSKVDEEEIRIFWLNMRNDIPNSFAELLQRQTEALPQIFQSFSYLDFLLVTNALSSSIALIPTSMRFDKFFKNRLEIDPMKATIQFVDIQGYWVHVQLYNRPWPNKPKNAISLVADGVSIIKVDKQLIRAKLLNLLNSKGFKEKFYLDVSSKLKIFSALLGKYVFWPDWNSSEESKKINKKWILIFIFFIFLHVSIVLIVLRWLIFPLEKNIDDLLSGNTETIESLPKELAEVDLALTKMKTNQKVFQKELIFRSASLQVLQNTELSADQMLEQINRILKSLFSGAFIEKIEFPVKNKQFISVMPSEDVRSSLENELNLKFPIYFRVKSSLPLAKKILNACAEQVEKIYLSLSIHISEKLSLGLTSDIDSSREFNDLMLQSNKVIIKDLALDFKISPRAHSAGDGYELVEYTGGFYLILVRSHSEPPSNTILTHALRSYMHGLVVTNSDTQTCFDRLSSYAYEISRDLGIDQSFVLINADSNSACVEYVGKGDIRFRINKSEIVKDWSSFSSKFGNSPSLVETVSLSKEIGFELATSDDAIHLSITIQKGFDA